MAITSQGYDGEAHEIDEVGWAGISGSFGADYGVRGLDGAPDENAGRVTTVSSAERTVAIAPAIFFGHGVRDRSDSTINVQLPAVAVGVTRWFLVAVRRDWQGNATVVAALPDAQASRVIPSQRLVQPGVQDDQPLALVPITGGQSIPGTPIDLRCWSGNAGLVAASTDALAYLNRLGSRVTVGRDTWIRAVGSTGSPEWIAPPPSDSGPLAVTGLNGFSASGTARARAGWAGMYGAFKSDGAGGITTEFKTLGRLPVGTRPPVAMLIPMYSNLTVPVQGRITPDGLVEAILVSGTQAISSATLFSIAGLSWPVE